MMGKTKWLSMVTASLIVLIGNMDYVLAQSFEEIPLKEDFDRYNSNEVDALDIYSVYFESQNPFNPPCDEGGVGDSASSDLDAAIYGNGLGKILDGYISIYKATKDKAYLYKFIHQSLCIMENRHDVQDMLRNGTITGGPKWSRACDKQAHHDGIILSGMSSFTFLIKVEEPSLQSEPLYPFAFLDPSNYQPETENCNYTGIQFSTFGDYANWLDNRITESLTFFMDNDYFSPIDGMRKEPGVESQVMPINMQGPFGRALFFNGISNSNSQLFNASVVIANRYRSNVVFTDGCINTPGGGVVYNEPVLQEKNGGYWWYQDGWLIHNHDCFPILNQPDLGEHEEHKEDISHGVMVTWFPVDTYLSGFSTPFSFGDMVRFRNMVTNNLYEETNASPLIYSAVDKSSGPIYTVSGACSGGGLCPPNTSYLKNNIINYIWLHKFDGQGGPAQDFEVYDIIMRYYENNLSGFSYGPPNYSPQQNMGHARMVKAQWENECPNLILYNRDVVYDQDFFSKNVLTVAPTQNIGSQDSYADPIISDPTFTVEPGISSEMTAQEEIILKTGFHAKPGSIFTARIDDMLCDGGQKSASTSGGQFEKASNVNTLAKANQDPTTPSFKSMKVSPNPVKDQGNVQTFFEEVSTVIIDLYDSFGRPVLNIVPEKECSGVEYHRFSSSSLSPGIYFVVMLENGVRIATEKVVVAK